MNAFILTLVVSSQLILANLSPKPDTHGMLTAHGWAMKNFMVEPAYDWFGDGNPTTDIYALFPPCAKDDYNLFHKDGKASFEEGEQLCFANGPQRWTGSWELLDEGTTIAITSNGVTEHWKIVKLTETKLVATYTITEAGRRYTFTSTFDSLPAQ